MGLHELFAGRREVSTSDDCAVARGIVLRHLQRCEQGMCRQEERLKLDLCQVLPEKVASEILTAYLMRRARSDPKAADKMEVEIQIALNDACVFGPSR